MNISTLQWADYSVNPDGFWRFQLDDVRMGDKIFSNATGGRKVDAIIVNSYSYLTYLTPDYRVGEKFAQFLTD